jgi:hypothetical protein
MTGIIYLAVGAAFAALIYRSMNKRGWDTFAG